MATTDEHRLEEAPCLVSETMSLIGWCTFLDLLAMPKLLSLSRSFEPSQAAFMQALRAENEQLRQRLTAVEGAAADALGELEDLQGHMLLFQGLVHAAAYSTGIKILPTTPEMCHKVGRGRGGHHPRE
eukprot:1158385-Pelagomonas_calceolata.AAC.7